MPKNMPKNVTDWTKPLVRILEGYEDLMKVTSDFPKIGKLPSLGKIPRVASFPVRGTAIVAVVVVVVCVAVAARPGAATSRELLRAKLLDVYSPEERKVLSDAIARVKKNPALVKQCLGIDYKKMGIDFMGNLSKVQAALK